VRKGIFAVTALGLILALLYVTLVAAYPYEEETNESPDWGYRNSKADAYLRAGYIPNSNPTYYYNILHDWWGWINPEIPDYIYNITTVDARETISNDPYHPYTITDTWVQVGANTSYYWDNEAEVLF
jgi:hypothetical protein